jgi:DNA-binding winged helix-turn-helix (wHTH) protein
MKTKYYILGVLAALCLLGTGYYVWTLYDAHCKQVTEWNEGAKAAFEEALWLEVNKRAEVPIYYSYSEKKDLKTLGESVSDSIFVTSPLGRIGYYIDSMRNERSLVKEAEKKAMLGALLYQYPLCVDTLAIHWNTILSDRKIPAQSKIRYVYTDWDLHNDTVFSVVDKRLSRLDSLTVTYMGFRCEHELVALVSYPHWLLSLSFNKCFWLFLPWVVFVLLVIFYTPIEELFRRKFVKEKIVEKEIHVADVPIDKAKIYHLPDESLFDSFAGTITKGDFVHTLPPQSSLLLKLFLRKENHSLTTMEIENGLWNGNGSMDKIHKAIQRLRVELKKVSPDLVIKNVNGDYELKLPISSKNLDKTEADED